MYWMREKKSKTIIACFERNSQSAAMLDVWRHAQWVCASLIRSWVGPCEVCLRVSFPYYAIDSGLKIYFFKTVAQSNLLSIKDRGNFPGRMLTETLQYPPLWGVHSLCPSSDLLVFRDIFKPKNGGQITFTFQWAKNARNPWLKCFFVLRSSVIGLYTKFVVITNN